MKNDDEIMQKNSAKSLHNNSEGSTKRSSRNNIYSSKNDNGYLGMASEDVFESIPGREDEDNEEGTFVSLRSEDDEPKKSPVGIIMIIASIIIAIIIGIIIWRTTRPESVTVSPPPSDDDSSLEDDDDINGGNGNGGSNNGGTGNNNNNNGSNGNGSTTTTPGPMEDNIESLITAFTNSEFFANSPGRYSFSGPKFNDGRTAGYRNASVSIMIGDTGTGFVGLFYRTPALGWQWFMVAEDTIPCIAFAEYDYYHNIVNKGTVNAFYGQPCLGGTNGTVQ